MIADDDNDASQLFIDDDLEMDQETINKNVQKAIERMDSDDIDVEKIMEFSDDQKGKYSDESERDEGDATESQECDVGCDVTGLSMTEDKSKPKACGHGFRINEAYLDKFQETRTPGGHCNYLYKLPLSENRGSGEKGVSDSEDTPYKTASNTADVTSIPLNTILLSWRTASGAEHIDNRGNAEHRNILETMAGGSEKDKHLINVLHSFTMMDSYSDTQDGRQVTDDEHTEGYGQEQSDGSNGGVRQDECDVNRDSVCDVMVNGDTEHDVMDHGNNAEHDGMDNGNTERDEDHVYALKSSEVERNDNVTVEVMNEEKVIDIRPDDSGELSNVVNLSGNVVYNATTGEVFNIDDIDISDLMEIYLVDM